MATSKAVFIATLVRADMVTAAGEAGLIWPLRDGNFVILLAILRRVAKTFAWR